MDDLTHALSSVALGVYYTEFAYGDKGKKKYGLRCPTLAARRALSKLKIPMSSLRVRYIIYDEIPDITIEADAKIKIRYMPANSELDKDRARLYLSFYHQEDKKQ